MSAELVIELLLNGLVLGSMYALMASGLSLIWGTLKIVNFAHGEFFMLGGFLVYYFYPLLGLPAPLAIILATLIVFGFAAVFERIIIHPLLQKPGWESSPIIATLGLSIFLQNFALKVWGERFKNIPYYFDGVYTLQTVRISEQRLLTLIIAIIVMLFGGFVLKYTRAGMALRAIHQDNQAAFLMGINNRSVFTWTFATGAALAALAATMLAPIFSVNPWMGVSLLLKAFVVSILGGLGSLTGAIIGGFLLGIIESLTVMIFASEWKDLVGLVMMLVVLWIFPNGIMNARNQ